MKKILSLLLVSVVVSACSNTQPSAVTSKSVQTSSNQISNLEPLNFSFSVKAASATRIKSLDAYLVTDPSNPEGTKVLDTNNNPYKIQRNVVNGVVNFIFTSYPSTGGPYHVALQAFDDIIGGQSRDNIIADNTNITSGDKKYAVSNDNVTLNNGVRTYSEGTALDVLIALIEANNIPLTIVPSSGSNDISNNISVSESETND